MSNNRCDEVRRWLARDAGPLAPPAELAAHAAGCPRCRGALAGLFARLAGPPPGGEEPGCASCADDIPAFVDVERAEGGAAALRRFPRLWWHLWTCAECAELCRLTAALVEAEAAGLIDPPPALAPAAPRPTAPPPLHLARRFLSELFGPQATLGAAWGEAPDRLLIAEEELPACRLAVYVRERPGGGWDIELTVVPPYRGRAVVRFAGQQFSGPLGPDGRAMVEGIPAALLAGASGPDMQISIEPEAADDPAR